MKICQLTSMHEWNDDRIYQRACLGLIRYGYDVHLVATKPINLPKQENVIFHWVEQRKGIKRRWFSSKEVVKKAISINADIYHFHDPDLLPHILKLKKRIPRAIVIYDIHENYTARFEQWKFINLFSNYLKRAYRKYEINIINRIDGYTVTTKSMQSLFKSSQKPWIEIRNSVDIERVKFINYDKDKYIDKTIYTSGTNSDARKVMETVKSLPIIHEIFPKVKMMFVGKYQDNLIERINKYSQDNNISESIVIEGMLPWEDNFKRTMKAHIGCVFYEDNLNNKVTLPNRLFEYMYCGIPVVGTKFKEVKEVIDIAECGVCVDSDKPSEIAKAIIYLLENPEISNDMGKKGKKAIETKFGYHLDLMKIIDFYKKLYSSYKNV